MSGTLKVGDTTHELNLMSLRDHSIGMTASRLLAQQCRQGKISRERPHPHIGLRKRQNRHPRSTQPRVTKHFIKVILRSSLEWPGSYEARFGTGLNIALNKNSKNIQFSLRFSVWVGPGSGICGFGCDEDMQLSCRGSPRLGPNASLRLLHDIPRERHHGHRGHHKPALHLLRVSCTQPKQC